DPVLWNAGILRMKCGQFGGEFGLGLAAQHASLRSYRVKRHRLIPAREPVAGGVRLANSCDHRTLSTTISQTSWSLPCSNTTATARATMLNYFPASLPFVVISILLATRVNLSGRVWTKIPSQAHLHKFRRRASMLLSRALASPRWRHSNRTHGLPPEAPLPWN